MRYIKHIGVTAVLLLIALTAEVLGGYIDIPPSGGGSGSAITALVGDVIAMGPGISTSSVTAVGGSTAANVHSGEVIANASSIVAGTPNADVLRDSAGHIQDISPTHTVTWWDDFDASSVSGSTGWNNNSTNGGDVKIEGPIDTGHPGIVKAVTNTNTNGVGCLYKDVSNVLGGGMINEDIEVYLPQLSNGTDRFSVEVGMSQQFNAAPYDGIWFSYEDDVNSGQWSANTGNGSVTTQGTGVAVAASTWYHLRLLCVAAGTSCQFYVNSTLTNTVTATLPTNPSAQKFGHVLQIRKLLGTTDTDLYIDYVRFFEILTTSR